MLLVLILQLTSLCMANVSRSPEEMTLEREVLGTYYELKSNAFEGLVKTPELRLLDRLPHVGVVATEYPPEINSEWLNGAGHLSSIEYNFLRYSPDAFATFGFDIKRWNQIELPYVKETQVFHQIAVQLGYEKIGEFTLSQKFYDIRKLRWQKQKLLNPRYCQIEIIDPTNRAKPFTTFAKPGEHFLVNPLEKRPIELSLRFPDAKPGKVSYYLDSKMMGTTYLPIYDLWRSEYPRFEFSMSPHRTLQFQCFE